MLFKKIKNIFGIKDKKDKFIVIEKKDDKREFVAKLLKAQGSFITSKKTLSVYRMYEKENYYDRNIVTKCLSSEPVTVDDDEIDIIYEIYRVDRLIKFLDSIKGIRLCFYHGGKPIPIFYNEQYVGTIDILKFLNGNTKQNLEFMRYFKSYNFELDIWNSNNSKGY